MKFPYSVKVNGKYYRPNQEIPDEVARTVSEEETVETESSVHNEDAEKSVETPAPKTRARKKA